MVLYEMKISVIIATKNARCGIEKTLRSIIGQSYTNIQLIVVDSQSDDGTIEIIGSYKDYIDVFISEKDSGIYDAWNKATTYVTGEWVQFLGAGDELPSSNTYELIIPHLMNAFPQYEMVYGNLELVSPSTGKTVEIISIPYNLMKNRWIEARPITPVHPEVFSHSTILLNSPFDNELKSAGDLKFMLQSLMRREPLYIDVLVDRMLLGGRSSDPRFVELVEQEREKVISQLGIVVPRMVKIRHSVKFFIKKNILTIFSHETRRMLVDLYRKLKRKNSYY